MSGLLITVLVSLVVVGLAVFILTKWLDRVNAAKVAYYARNVAPDLSLSLEEAEFRARAILQQAERVRTVAASGAPPMLLSQLGVETQKLFGEFSLIEDRLGELSLGWNHLRREGGYIRIGSDHELSQHVVDLSDGSLRWLDEDGTVIQSFRSIFHLLVMQIR